MLILLSQASWRNLIPRLFGTLLGCCTRCPRLLGQGGRGDSDDQRVVCHRPFLKGSFDEAREPRFWVSAADPRGDGYVLVY